MKLFKVELDNVDYDTFDGCIVVAETEREVFEYITSSKVAEQFFIKEGQNMTIKEIKFDEYKEPAILLSSFNAG